VSNFTYNIKITSTWENGYPSKDLTRTSPDWLEFIQLNAFYHGELSSSIHPDSNTVIRYCTDSATVLKYVTALTNLCTFLDRNDWSYILENGSITEASGIGAWSTDNSGPDDSRLTEWSTSWVPAP
jgi:hypothetical protein